MYGTELRGGGDETAGHDGIVRGNSVLFTASYRIGAAYGTPRSDTIITAASRYAALGISGSRLRISSISAVLLMNP